MNIIFNYNFYYIGIQSKLDDKIKKIIQKLLVKIDRNREELNFLYGGRQINEELTVEEQINSQDRERKKMSILVIDKKTQYNPIIIKKKAKNIICPICKENIRIVIKDFKISLFDCKNDHKIDCIFFKNFGNTQYIDESKIICKNCNKKNKSEIYGNQFFFCKLCQINLCPLCKNAHDRTHNIRDYEQKDSFCDKHNESYFSYCQNCKKNICLMDEKEHIGHKCITIGRIMSDKNDLKNKLNILETKINEFKNEIKNIVNELNNIMENLRENLDNYYNIYENVVNNYETTNRNYTILQNIIDLNDFNNILIENISKIIQDKNIKNKFNFMIDIYNKMNNKNEEEISNNIPLGNQLNNSIITNNSFISNGTKHYESGEYSGEFKNNLRDGKGTFLFNSGNKYEGEFKNDKMEGKGIFYYTNGDRYEGEVKNNMREGKGIAYFNGGCRYEGEWKNNLRDGKGIYYYTNGNKYEGDWKYGKKDGKGTFYFFNGNRYEGDIKNDYREGKGIGFYINGFRYEGDWKNGLKDGKGIGFYPDGSRYDGDWKSDQRNGAGICYYTNGNREMGNYMNDRKIGKHVTLTALNEIVSNNYS